MSNLPVQTTPVYATDEDIAVRAGGDFITLCPAWQQMAAGEDGAFVAGSPWVLTSTATNFAANGVAPNQVVYLTAPKSQYPGGGALLAIDSVAGSSLTLRRLHKDLGVGQPPAPLAGLVGVAFAVNTLDPQTEEASFDLKRRFGIDETIVDRQSTWVFDLRDLRMATVLSVLVARYTQEARGDKGDFPRKIGQLKSELGQVLDRVQVRWGPFGNSEEPTTIFSCRLSR
ncbi:MAG TPA: hypothetical protein VG125_26420 [Pirellulales bacterium]|nr:hypothetical protein [Pirellulales bacterium]